MYCFFDNGFPKHVDHFLEWLTDLGVVSLTWKSEGYFKRLSSIETFERP